MNENNKKYLDTLATINEYKRTALSRLDMFYLAVSKNFPQFDTYADKEAAKRFPRAYKIDEQEIEFLGRALREDECDVYVDELSADQVIFKMFDNKGDVCLEVDAIFAFGTTSEFTEYIQSLKQELQEYNAYLKENEINSLNDKERAEFNKYLELKSKYEELV